MKRLIRYSETPQITGLEYKELFSYRKEKSPAVRTCTKKLVKYRTMIDKAAYFESLRGLKGEKRNDYY